MAKKRLSLRELILFGILGAMTFSLKVVMAGLPNIEPVSVLLLVYAAVFGYKALYPMSVYVVMEVMLYGLGIWNLYYLYVWPILVLVGIALRKTENPVAWAFASGTFGLLFGTLCAIADMFIGGFGYALAKWVSGIPFDITHCVGNFFIALVLFRPLRELLDRLYRRLG